MLPRGLRALAWKVGAGASLAGGAVSVPGQGRWPLSRPALHHLSLPHMMEKLCVWSRRCALLVSVRRPCSLPAQLPPPGTPTHT